MLKIIIKNIFFIILINNYSFQLSANKIVISNVSIEGNNLNEKYTFIKLDVNGENAWHSSINAQNWNSIWLFAKYRVNNGNWQHALLSKIDSEHINSNGLITDAQQDGTGVFIYYSTAGDVNFNTYNITDLKLRWNYGENGLNGDETDIDIQVFGIEMIYIPQNSFYIGSGGNENNHFYTYPNSNTPYQITNENEINVGTNSGNLYYNSNDGPFNEGGDQSGPIPQEFPKGYNAFYIMKYEISQEQYVDFLNTLTRTEQEERVNISFTYVLSSTNGMQNRNGIKSLSLGAVDDPLFFYCDYTSGTQNDINDGQNIACNFLSWDDGLAYLDWSGLRPMTELEFEKACRGTLDPVSNEYAWGSLDLTIVSSTINNNGETSEVVDNQGNGLCNFDIDDEGGIDAPINAPLRCGYAATSSTNRIQSGSSYYGVMELSGNLSEHCVSVGSSAGRTFTGNNGDGNISTSTNWPNFHASGGRGGNFTRDYTRLQISDRSRATIASNNKFSNAGWRGVRNAE
ncbi:MAG: SUMF1/EgtB/PvdO family nonheme iron enzyme [Bacteroidales bacterium]|nr:SUMF1/EgtB/PvdO family nonheme iron enzyme [Bacteroidales bacterium]